MKQRKEPVRSFTVKLTAGETVELAQAIAMDLVVNFYNENQCAQNAFQKMLDEILRKTPPVVKERVDRILAMRELPQLAKGSKFDKLTHEAAKIAADEYLESKD